MASLTGIYWTCHTTLNKFVAYTREFMNKYDMKWSVAESQSTILARLIGPSGMVAVSAHVPATDSVFSLDPRGILRIVVDKPTYERLGLVGTRMRWKGCDDMYREWSF